MNNAVDPRYQNGYIYKISNSASNDPFDIYIGSSMNKPNIRFGGHKSIWQQIVNGKKPSEGMILYDAFTQHGIANFRLIVLLAWPCNNRHELVKKEEEIRLQLKPNYNVNRAYVDPAVQKEEHTVWAKDWRAGYKAIETQRRKAKEAIAVFECDACGYKCPREATLFRHNTSKRHKLEYDEYIFDCEMDRLADITVFD
jgi:hypothetical protein